MSDFIEVPELAARLGRSEYTTRELIRTQRVPTIDFGRGKRKVPRIAFLQWVANATVPADVPEPAKTTRAEVLKDAAERHDAALEQRYSKKATAA